MPRTPRGPKDVRASRPASPYFKNGKLNPREWRIALSAAGVLNLFVLPGKPWFVGARPIEIPQQGVELEVFVRWLDPGVVNEIPIAVDGYPVRISLAEEQAQEQAPH
jgi:hypothetical protein